MATEMALLTTAALKNLNRCERRFSAVDVGICPEFFHYTDFDPQCGNFGWVGRARGKVISVVWAPNLPLVDSGYEFLAANTSRVNLGVGDDWHGRGLGTCK